MKQVALKIYGKVQGVGFRYNTKKKAEDLGISGFVGNKPDGTVYVEASGKNDDVEEFVSWCESGPKSAHVEKVKRLKPKQPGTSSSFSEFKIFH